MAISRFQYILLVSLIVRALEKPLNRSVAKDNRVGLLSEEYNNRGTLLLFGTLPQSRSTCVLCKGGAPLQILGGKILDILI